MYRVVCTKRHHVQPPHGVPLQQLRAPVNSMSRSMEVVVCFRSWRAPSTRSMLAPYDYVCSSVRCTWALCDVVASVPKNIGVQFDPSQLDDHIARFSHAMAISSRFAVVPKFCGILSARNECVLCANTDGTAHAITTAVASTPLVLPICFDTSIGVELRPLRSCHFFPCVLELCVMNISVRRPTRTTTAVLEECARTMYGVVSPRIQHSSDKTFQINCCVSPSQSITAFLKKRAPRAIWKHTPFDNACCAQLPV